MWSRWVPGKMQFWLLVTDAYYLGWTMRGEANVSIGGSRDVCSITNCLVSPPETGTESEKRLKQVVCHRAGDESVALDLEEE